MARSDLCHTTSLTISGWLLMLAEFPCQGGILNDGAKLFKPVSDKMGIAIPGTNWISDAADKYLNQNIAQQVRAQLMGELYVVAGGMIATQATHITNCRAVLRGMRTVVDGVKWACQKLEKIWRIGDGLSWALAIPACAFAMAVTGGTLLVLTLLTMANATQLAGLTGRLSGILTTLPKFPGQLDLTIPGIPGSIDDLWPPQLADIPIPGLPDILGIPEFVWPPKFPDSGGWPELPAFPEFPNFPDLPGVADGIPIPDFPTLTIQFQAYRSPGFPACLDYPLFRICSPASQARVSLIYPALPRGPALLRLMP